MPLSSTPAEAILAGPTRQPHGRSGFAPRRRPKRIVTAYLALHSLCFFMYASFGRGFAHFGYQPLFIGEVLLFFGLWVAFRTGQVSKLGATPIGLLLIVFSVWNLTRTAPFFGLFGVDALRDAMLWIYSLFAWIIAAVVMRTDNCISLTVLRFQSYGGAMLILMIGSFIATTFFPSILPVWPGTMVTFPYMKPGDLCVEAAGLIVYWLIGLGPRNTRWLTLGLFVFLAGAMFSRGGMAAGIAALGIAFLFYPDFRRILVFAPGVIFSIALLLIPGLEIHLPKSQRVISAHQFLMNLESSIGIESDFDDPTLNRDKEWRLKWWNIIYNYTLHGPYFWTGKGFGVNLTVSDGMIRTEADYPGLRSPHNSHITFLARSGVPGLVFWITLQATWAFLMLRGYRFAKMRGLAAWAKLFVWLLAFWIAFVINAAFDVSLEGPTCGIPFWTIFGLGWGGYLRFKREIKGMGPSTRRATTAMSRGALGPAYVAQGDPFAFSACEQRGNGAMPEGAAGVWVAESFCVQGISLLA